MNKLLQTKLKSIEHYNDQIKELEYAISVTKSTQDDILQSMKEFVPLSPDDRVMFGGFFYKVGSIGRLELRDGRARANIKIHIQVKGYYDAPEWSKEISAWYYFDKPEEWKIVEHAKQ